jgi:hypothetical protein
VVAVNGPVDGVQAPHDPAKLTVIETVEPLAFIDQLEPADTAAALRLVAGTPGRAPGRGRSRDPPG